MHVEPVKAGDGENRRVHLPVVDLAQPRRNVAAEIDDLEVTAACQEQRTPAKTRGADATAARQLVDRADTQRIVDDERVSRVLTLEDRGEDYAVRRFGRKILQRMDAALDLPGAQRVLELLGEQPLGADRVERLIDPLVSGGLERDELGRDVACRERSLHLAGLTQRQLRGARRDADYVSVPGQSRVDSMRSRSHAACSGTKYGTRVFLNSRSE